MDKKKIIATISFFFLSPIFAASLPVEIAPIPFIKVYNSDSSDMSGWLSENAKDKISLWSFEGVATIEAQQASRSWAAVYHPVSVDLSRQSVLQINVLSATKQWYLILVGPQFKKGFFRLIESKETGLFSFDIPKLTDLKDKQKFGIKIGVRDPSGKRVANERVSFDKLVFLGRESLQPAGEKKTPPQAFIQKEKKAKSPSRDALAIFDPDHDNPDLWQESVKDGPLEVHYYEKEGMAIVKGEMDSQNYAAVHRQVTVDLDQFPWLAINVPSCSNQWYLILKNPSIPEGMTRFIESDKIGAFRFDVRERTGLSGMQTFDLQVGVSAPENWSVRGEWMAFDRLEFERK